LEINGANSITRTGPIVLPPVSTLLEFGIKHPNKFPLEKLIHEVKMINWQEIALVVEELNARELTDGKIGLGIMRKIADVFSTFERVVDMIFWSLVNQKPLFSSVTKMLMDVIRMQQKLVALSSKVGCLDKNSNFHKFPESFVSNKC